MWLARSSASESTIALITAKVATSPSVPAGLLFEALSGASSHRRGASGFHRVVGPENLIEPPEGVGYEPYS